MQVQMRRPDSRLLTLTGGSVQCGNWDGLLLWVAALSLSLPMSIPSSVCWTTNFQVGPDRCWRRWAQPRCALVHLDLSCLTWQCHMSSLGLVSPPLPWSARLTEAQRGGDKYSMLGYRHSPK